MATSSLAAAARSLVRVALVASALLVSTGAPAQEISGTIAGRVLSADGSPLEGATVTVLHEPTGATRTVTSSTDGRFQVSGLRVGGPFRVSATKEGFDAATLEEINTVLGQPTVLDLALASAGLQEVVVAGTRLRAAEIGATSEFSSRDIANLPSVSRDVKSIVRLDPKVIIDPTNVDAIEIAGTNSRYNSITIDGIRQSDDFGLNNNGYPTQRSPISIDAVEAVSVRTAPFDVRDSGFQGGTVTLVTKSGTNDLEGSAYYYKYNDSLVGDRNKENDLTFQFDEKTFGATLGGPILKDRLFFFLSYEKLERTSPVELGPTGSGLPVDVPGVSLADYEEIVDIARDIYGFDPGELTGALPEEDEKILVKLDWNINDQHRMALAYQKSDGNGIVQNSTNNSVSLNRIASPSNWYNRAFPLEQLSLQMFSNWSDNFSTELKIGRKEVTGIQASLQGTEFAEMQIRTTQGGTVFIGPDQFRHANELANDLDQFKLSGDYRLGNHTLSAGVELEKLDVFNLFVSNSEGQYLFNRVDPLNPGAAIDDFRARTAQSFTYQNAISNDADDAAAVFKLDTWSLFLQDRWQITPSLSLIGGVRLDKYKSNDVPPLNENFVDRYGFDNQETFDGRELISPRVGLTWELDERTTISGGVGLFGGGSPNVWLSNSYSNTGVATSQITVNSTSPAPLQTAVLTNIDGFEIPSEAQALLVAGDGPVNAIDPDFEIPSSWRWNLSGSRTFDFGRLGDEWRIGADFIYTKVRDAVLWRDLRLLATGTAPDGRPIYSLRPGDARPSASNDLLLTNTSEGSGMISTLDISKSWRTNAGRFDLYFGYAHQDVEDVNAGTSSTALSNWDNLATADINDPALATSNYEIKHRFPLSFTWRKAFFGDHDTSVGLFMERRSGRPFSYTFGGSSSVFGDPRQNSRQRQLFYVPRDASEINLAGGLTWEALDSFIESSGLDRYRGSIAPRNAFTSPWYTVADLRLSQELPAFFRDAKGIISLDIENFANLINNDWGRLSQVSFPYVSPVVQVNGITDGRYTYAPVSGQTGPRTVVNSISALPSVWRIQLGIKFQF
jgi:outer membrane receptor for ferrienterochelin and colicin